MDRSAVTQRIWAMAEPLASGLGLELIDVQNRTESGRHIVRVLLDRPDGHISLEELSRVSRELSDLLDAHDVVPGRYNLECSSPGLNRPLVRPTHFQRAVGQRVTVRTRTPIEGRRTFHGVLDAAAADDVIVRDPDAGTVRIPLAEIEKANTEFEFARPSGGSPA